MDELRWLLLGFGVLTVVAVYFFSRRGDSEASDSEDSTIGDTRLEPTLGTTIDGEDVPEADIDVEPPVAEPPGYGTEGEMPVDAEAPLSEAAQPQPPVSEKIVTLRIIARDRGAFAGDELILSLRGIGMRHGKFGIFHRHEGDESSPTIFSAASLVEPGSFDLSNIKQQMIPGISMFAVFPGPIEGVEAFDLMMAAARAIAKAMDADLLDESGSTLSIQRERYLREEIIQFEHSLQVTN